MDISTIVETNRTVDILHPATHEPTGIKIEVAPMTSPAVKAVERKWANENYRTRFKTLTAEKAEAQRLDVLVAATAGWSWGGNTNFEGEKPDFTPENVRRVYRALPWLRRQVDDALGEDSEFFRSADNDAD